MLVHAKCSSEMKKSKKSAATKPRVQQPYRFKSFKKASPAAGLGKEFHGSIVAQLVAAIRRPPRRSYFLVVILLLFILSLAPSSPFPQWLLESPPMGERGI